MGYRYDYARRCKKYSTSREDSDNILYGGSVYYIISWFPNIAYTLVPFVCVYVCGGCACVCIRKKFGRIHTEILPMTVSGCWSYK